MSTRDLREKIARLEHRRDEALNRAESLLFRAQPYPAVGVALQAQAFAQIATIYQLQVDEANREWERVTSS